MLESLLLAFFLEQSELSYRRAVFHMRGNLCPIGGSSKIFRPLEIPTIRKNIRIGENVFNLLPKAGNGHRLINIYDALLLMARTCIKSRVDSRAKIHAQAA